MPSPTSALQAWRRPGLASDADLAAMGADRPRLRLTLELDTGHAGCAGSHHAHTHVPLVGLDVADPGLTDQVRDALRELPPGHAAVTAARRELLGVSVAVRGHSLRVSSLVPAGPPLLVAAFADVASLIVNGNVDARPPGLVTSTTVLLDADAPGPDGWVRHDVGDLTAVAPTRTETAA